MKKIAAVLLALICLTAAAQTPQEKYIQKYAPIAVKEMQRSGVPASITLAQGLLESGNGLSALAVNGNNHFRGSHLGRVTVSSWLRHCALEGTVAAKKNSSSTPI